MAATVDEVLGRARSAQREWAASPLHARLGILARLRHALARNPDALLDALAGRRPVADTLAAEVLPLLEAIRFLERRAPALLRPRRERGGRPLWLAGVRAETRREPIGVVLILAPSNFPLMLPGIQLLQAVAAGNAACVKPAPGWAGPMRVLRDALIEAGLPADVVAVLDDGVDTGRAAARAGFDKIVLTGSAATGAAVLAAAAPMLTPATMELSGSDAMFVLPSADLALVADCLAYTLRLNDGEICIAPRRVFVPAPLLPALEQALHERISGLPRVRLREHVAQAVAQAVAAGVRAEPDCGAGPLILVHHRPAALRVLAEDLFAPVVSLIAVGSAEEALAADRDCPYALGATIFGAPDEAAALVPHVRAGSVVINDVIVPTADPRLAFGGRGRSGFGVTRGAEGLLEMTAIKTVSIRSGRFRPHLRPPAAKDAAMLRAMIQLLHGTRGDRLRALARFRG